MKYCVNDIDETMEEIEKKASSSGFFINHTEGAEVISLTEPSFFPEHKTEILEAVKKCFDRECSKNCNLCFFPHPMLMVEEFTYVKLCTVIAMRIFPQVRTYVKSLGLKNNYER